MVDGSSYTTTFVLYQIAFNLRAATCSTKHERSVHHFGSLLLQKIVYDPPLQYCAEVMQMNFDEIPGFSWLFEEIWLEIIFRGNFPAFS